jgi:hypothetical protein
MCIQVMNTCTTYALKLLSLRLIFYNLNLRFKNNIQILKLCQLKVLLMIKGIKIGKVCNISIHVSRIYLAHY